MTFIVAYFLENSVNNNGKSGKNGMHEGHESGVVGVVSADEIEGKEELESQASAELIEGERDEGMWSSYSVFRVISIELGLLSADPLIPAESFRVRR